MNVKLSIFCILEILANCQSLGWGRGNSESLEDKSSGDLCDRQSSCRQTSYLGPALRTSSLGNVNCVKFFLKRAARSEAWRSYASLSAQVLRGMSTSLGTSGQDVGELRPKIGSVNISTLSSAPLIAALTIARV